MPPVIPTQSTSPSVRYPGVQEFGGRETFRETTAHPAVGRLVPLHQDLPSVHGPTEQYPPSLTRT